ncbi:MAG: hypothetical protein U9N07_05535 [Euryarchaeota archaeon]|nr:hypothetical protein [Euryarchaeota archaeon]
MSDDAQRGHRGRRDMDCGRLRSQSAPAVEDAAAETPHAPLGETPAKKQGLTGFHRGLRSGRVLAAEM